MRISIKTFGCRLNYAESAEIAEKLAEAGLEMADDKPDIIVINTCTVTANADRRCLNYICKAREKNPKIKIIATGCGVKVFPEKYQGVADDLVEKRNVVSLINEGATPRRSKSRIQQEYGRTRAFIKIQDGCNNFCAYCIVPYARGREKSVAAASIISQIKKAEKAGYQEVVLTGVNVSRYQGGLASALEAVLKQTGMPRIRLGSLHPEVVDQQFLAVVKNPRICPHFHLSLQSGSDRILKIMGRPYTLADYQKSIDVLRSALPDVAISTDLIVGFPGETDRDFADSLRFCRQMGFMKIHVFPYSRRTGTKAADLPDQIPLVIKKQRSRQAQELSDELRLEYMKRFVGQQVEVLFESQKGGKWFGYSKNYLPVLLASGDDLLNRIVGGEIGGIEEGRMVMRNSQ